MKCFNTVFAEHMDKGRVGDKQLTVFAAGDHVEARRTVLGLGTKMGLRLFHDEPGRAG